MAVKSIIDIEINDDAFKRFYELFHAYTEELETMPEAWQSLGAAMGESTKDLESGAVSSKEALGLAAAQATLIVEALHNATKAQQDFSTETRRSETGMEKLSKTAQGVGKAIAMIGGWALKLVSIGSVSTILSGFGLDRLAESAVRQSRFAGGAGVSTGLAKSFEINAQPFLDATALTTAANLQSDIRNAGYFAALGMTNFRQIQSESAAQLPFDILQKAVEQYNKVGPARAGTTPGLTRENLSALGLSLEQVRYASAHPQELAAARAATFRDQNKLDIDRQTAEAMRKLMITLQEAGAVIENTLINRLAPMAPVFERLTNDFADWITGILNSKGFEQSIQDATKALGGMLTFLEGVHWKELGDEINWVVGKFGDLAKHLGFVADNKTGAAIGAAGLGIAGGLVAGPAGAIAGTLLGGAAGAEIELMTKALAPTIGSIGSGIGGVFSSLAHVGGSAINSLKGASASTINAITSTAQSYGVDPVLALATAINESGLNPKSIGDKGTSFGLYQLHEGGELGNLSAQQAFNPRTNAAVALREFQIVASHHPNLSPGEIAARAQRPAEPEQYAANVNAIYSSLISQMRQAFVSSVDADVKRFGRSWESHLPPDVRRFLTANLSKAERQSVDISSINKAITRALNKKTQPSANILITNNTPSRVHSSTHAAAAGS